VSSDPALPPKPGPQSPFALMQQALIREVPCAFTGLEFTGDPSSTGLEERPVEPAQYTVRVAPLGPAELAAIDKVEADFPDFELVGVEARQSYAEADVQIHSISAAIGHYNSGVGMERDGSVTAEVYGVPEDQIAEVRARIADSTEDDAVQPTVSVTSEPSSFQLN